jgi:two-component system, chemotaxis family, chemotaxis protein CheY
MKVLVVDDSSVVRSMMKKILANLGYQVVQAENGAIGLEVLEANSDTRLLMVDWNMPVMNGIEMINLIRSEERWRDLKIIMVTTETEPKQIMRALNAGTNEYIMKPFTPDIISEKIRLLDL